MTLTLISEPQYTIDTLGFAERIFTAGSPQYLALPDAVRFATKRNSVLQSAPETVAFRLAAEGADFANDHQTTRTAAIYFKNNDRCYVAFDDDPNKNILLARAQKGYEAHKTAGKWLVDKNDPLIRAALRRAEKAERIIETPLENGVRLATMARNGTSDYGTSKLIRATIGDFAEPYAHFLNKAGYGNGHEWFLTSTNLHQLGVDDDHVEVRRVGVGGNDNYNVSYLDADDRCGSGGRARGVARKTSIGNRGDA